MKMQLNVNQYGFQFYIEADTKEEAEIESLKFPKTCKMHVSSLSHPFEEGKPVTYLARCHTALKANKINGGINETGIKRLATIKKTVKTLYGIDLNDEKYGVKYNI